MHTNEEKMQVLAAVAEAFQAAHIRWALGASGMLYLRGITDTFHDLDIVVETGDALRAKEILLRMGTLHPSTPEIYHTRYFFEFTVQGVDIDLMGGFAIERDGVVYDCSFHPEEIDGYAEVCGQSVPLHAASVWRRYYTLMGRTAKAAMLDAFLSE